MAKQLVDITTIDNVTPFTKVRWKSVMTYAGDDTWLAEAPGLNTAGMSWTEGSTAALGYFGGHRMNHNSAWGNAYTCSMNCEQYGIDQSTIAYRVAVKDGSRAARPEDFLILFRHRKIETMNSICDELKKRKIPVSGVDRVLLKDEIHFKENRDPPDHSYYSVTAGIPGIQRTMDPTPLHQEPTAGA